MVDTYFYHGSDFCTLDKDPSLQQRVKKRGRIRLNTWDVLFSNVYLSDIYFLFSFIFTKTIQ